MVRVNAAPDAIVDEPAKQGDPINEAISDAINEAINEAIKSRPGINRPQLVNMVKKSRATVERSIAYLVEKGRIEHRGSKKTGGYYAL